MDRQAEMSAAVEAALRSIGEPISEAQAKEIAALVIDDALAR